MRRLTGYNLDVRGIHDHIFFFFVVVVVVVVGDRLHINGRVAKERSAVSVTNTALATELHRVSLWLCDQRLPGV